MAQLGQNYVGWENNWLSLFVLQYDTLPEDIKEEDMKPGDLVFISAIYYDKPGKKCKSTYTQVINGLYTLYSQPNTSPPNKAPIVQVMPQTYNMVSCMEEFKWNKKLQKL